jgi:hypothetical protein
MESGDSFLFDEQVISITSQAREHSYTLIIDAIKRAVRASFASKQTTPIPSPAAVEAAVERAVEASVEATSVEAAVEAVVEVPQSTPERIHDLLDGDPENELMATMRSKFGTAMAAFNAFSNERSLISKKEWRRIIKKMLPTKSKAEAKAMTKQLPKKVNLLQFCELMDKVNSKGELDTASKSTVQSSSHLADLPSDVPVLPNSFKSRPHAHEQLVAALLDSGGNRSTSVTAPKSRVSSQGMGGVGKTMLTAAVVRDERVRGAFECIAWIGMSQEPDLLQLQRTLYHQLHPENGKMPSNADSVGSQLTELRCTQLMEVVHTNCILTRRLSSGRVLLVCFDDICE